MDKPCVLFAKESSVIIDCKDEDNEYFVKYFDLDFNYQDVYKKAILNDGIIKQSAEFSKGIRILNQDREETLFSFIISQNNNIARIRSLVKKIAENLGKRSIFCSKTAGNIVYYSFPDTNKIIEKDTEFYKGLGLGYRAEYLPITARKLLDGFLLEKEKLSTVDLKKELKSIKGVGPKVADCVSLFGFHRFDSFPVDTWLEDFYREDICGNEKKRKKKTNI